MKKKCKCFNAPNEGGKNNTELRLHNLSQLRQTFPYKAYIVKFFFFYYDVLRMGNARILALYRQVVPMILV